MRPSYTPPNWTNWSISSDRCIVMYRGAIVAEVPQDKLTPHWLLSLAAGHHGAAPLEP